MSVMLSKQLYGQLLAQIYKDLIFRVIRDSRVENVHPYKNYLQRVIVTRLTLSSLFTTRISFLGVKHVFPK